MSYRLSFSEDVAESTRACLLERLDDAIVQLEDGEDPVAAVHTARKDLKKSRALLRLIAPALGRQTYRSEAHPLRDAARSLAQARDADVMAQTVERLSEWAVGRAPAAAFAELREELAKAAQQTPAATGAAAEPALEVLREARRRAATLDVEAIDVNVLAAGLARSHERGRRAFAQARQDPTPERLHEWRKRVKDLWYHRRLLYEAWPGVLEAEASEAKTLSELLGDDHDLVVLADVLGRPDGPAQAVPDPEPLLAAIAARRAELLEQALRLGERLYAERPRAVARRIGTYLTQATSEAQADGRVPDEA